MIRVLRSAATATWTAAIVLIVAAGAITIAAHLAAPLLGGFRTDVEQWLESTLRAPVRIEGMAVRWRAHGPQLVARDVTVLDVAGKPAIELRELTVAVEVGDILRDWRLRPSDIGIAGVRLHIMRRIDGSLDISGLRSPSEGPATAGAPESREAALLLLLPGQLDIADAEIVIEDRMRGRPSLAFRNANLRLHNDQHRHTISASLELPGPDPVPVHLAGVLTADPDGLESWQADLYLETRGAELAQLSSHFVPPHYRLEGARADLRSWSRWEGGEPTWVEGRATLTNLGLSGVASGRGLRVERVTGAFRWDRRPDGWVLRVADFALDRPDRAPEPTEWALAWRRDAPDRGPALRLVGERIELEDLAAVLAVRPPDAEALGRLLDARPRGTLRGLDLLLAQRVSGDWWWSATGRLEDGALAGDGAVPGIERLALAFSATADGGRLDLLTRDAELRSPEVFRRPLDIDSLDGTLTWRAVQGDGWRIQGSDLLGASGEFRLSGRLDLTLSASGAATIDLDAHLAAVPVDHVLPLLPVGVMKPDLVGWLDQALRGGTIRSGTCRVQGPLADFPFDERPTGLFDAAIAIEGTNLDYAPGWPGLRNLDGAVRMRNYVLEIGVDRATVYESRVTHGTARLDAPPGAPLEFQGAVEGPLGDPLRLLRESPLREDFGEIASHLQGSGNSRIELDLAVPIDDLGRGRERVAGAVVLLGSELRLARGPLVLETIEGRLGFDQGGLRAKGIQAQLLGSPTLIDIQTEKSGTTNLNAVLRKVEVQRLNELAGDALAGVRGAAAVKARLEVPPLRTRGNLGLRLQSDLRGVAVDLPPPIGKPAEAARSLAIDLTFPPEGAIAAAARYGNDLDLAAQIDARDGRPLRATLALGGPRADAPMADRFELRGRVPSLDLPAWLAWVGTLPAQAEGQRRRLPIDVELATDRLILGDGSLAEARLSVRETDEGWQGEIRATELEGSFRYPRRIDRGSASLSLDRLTLAADPTQPAGAAAGRRPLERPRQDPRALPAATIEVRRFQLNGHEMGAVRITAARVEDGLQLREIAIEGPAGRLGGGGDWLMTQGAPRTALNFALDTPDFGHLIVVLGFADSIDKGRAKINGELNWPGHPFEISRESLSGQIDLDLRAGRFVDIDPGVGRVMGLLNVAAIQRRLTLDFSDLFGKGLGFDTVTGHFQLAAGSVRTEDLRIKGPSGVIDISGRTDVVAQAFDQAVTVTPSLGATLPIAGAVVGGPVVGAAMLVVQGLVGKQVDQIGAVRYSVKGPWSDPEIQVLAGRPARELMPEAGKTEKAPPPSPVKGQQPPAPVEGREAEDAAAAPTVSPGFHAPGIH